MSNFSEGQSHALALALHERTEWPIIVTFTEGNPAMHFLVLTGDGLMMDNEGLKDEATVMARYDDPTADLDITSPLEVNALVYSGWFAPVDMAAARARATELLVDYTRIMLQRASAIALLHMETITPEQAHVALDTLRSVSYMPMQRFSEEV